MGLGYERIAMNASEYKGMTGRRGRMSKKEIGGHDQGTVGTSVVWLKEKGVMTTIKGDQSKNRLAHINIMSK